MKIKKILFLVLVILLVCCLISCSKRGNIENAELGVTIHFDLQYETKVQIPDVHIDSTTEAYMPNDPVRLGYVFGGWYYESTCENKFSTKDGITEDITLYAKWIEEEKNVNPGELEEETNDDLGFTYLLINETTAAVKGYDGDAENVVIQSTFGKRNITRIVSNAFYGNSKIKSITIPKGITEIDNNAFGNCSKLNQFKVNNDNQNYSSDGAVLFDKYKTTIVCVPAGIQSEQFVISKNISKISEYAFSGVKSDIQFDEENSITQLTKNMFAESEGDIYLPKTIEILQAAFYDSKSNIIFDTNTTMNMIWPSAFESYKGNKLIIPSSITYIGKAAFKNCTAIIDLSLTTFTTITESVFAEYKGESILIPKHIENIEKNAFDKSTTEITFEENSKYKVIKAQTFQYFNGVLNMPTGITSIKQNAFINAHATIKLYTQIEQGVLEEDFPNTCQIVFLYD
ncbi:MAG: leucine-rich repeat protein, partial [Clostridia bacterium]|nr:leucine-rich repeat protein [Clostridia bacterium]